MIIDLLQSPKVKWLAPIMSLVNSGEAESTPLNATPLLSLMSVRNEPFSAVQTFQVFAHMAPSTQKTFLLLSGLPTWEMSIHFWGLF